MTELDKPKRLAQWQRVSSIGVARIFDWGGAHTSGGTRKFWWGGFQAQTLKNSDVFTEIESDFSAEVGNSNVFSAQNQVVSKKKKKKKRSSPILRLNFRPKSQIRRFFSPKIWWSPKRKKKRKVFTEIESDFS